jgi:pyruvate dehydrogenase E2 component (dihydrolipoamide acetyltransferase)
MSTLEFKLPDIGEGVHEGEIVRWIVPVGGVVNEDDPVVEVMTDKATVEIPAPSSGTVTQHTFAEGDVAKVGDVIFVIEAGDGAASAPAAAPAAAAPAAAAAVAAPAAPAPTGGGQLEFKLPDIGEGVHEGEIVRWIVPEGASVAEDDPVVEVMTDKATVEIPAPAAGTIARHMVTEGEVAKVGDVIFVIATGGGSAAAAPAAAAPTAPAAAPASNGSAAPAPSTGGAAAEPAAPVRSFPMVAGSREVDRVPFRGIRRKTAEAMARSKYTAPHFSLIEEVDCTDMVAARKKAKAVGERHGIKVTFMPYIMKATAIALQEFPQLNAELDVEANEILVKKYVNLGIAVDTPNGLVVPVVKDVHLKGILQISAELSDIAARARVGKLAPDDFKDSTFTLSNAGNIGGVFATPIINFPEVAIMGIHTMRKMPRCVGDDIVAREVMMLSISIDHRLVDGADGARFMVRVRELLEDPDLMLL